MKRSRKAFALGLVAPLLVVSGCSGGDPQPKIAPSVSAVGSPSVSLSASPVPLAPDLPPAARTHDGAGAAAFVRYYIDVLNFAQRSGDTARLNALSAAHCAACGGYIKAIRRAYDAGGGVSGGLLSIGHLRALPPDYGAEWGGYTKGRASAQVIEHGDGTKDRYPGGAFSLYAYTIWSDHAWSMQWMRTPE